MYVHIKAMIVNNLEINTQEEDKKVLFFLSYKVVLHDKCLKLKSLKIRKIDTLRRQISLVSWLES